MILIGQFDSPVVRRVAIAMRLYGIEFEHRPWSTFGDADKIAAYNPLRRVPTLVLTGDGDKLIPMEHSDTLVELLRRDGGEQVEYVVVPEAGHMVPLEKPDEVTRALVRLIRRATAGHAPR